MTRTAVAPLLVQKVALTPCGKAAFAQAIRYQPAIDRPTLARTPAGPAELAQFDCLAGDWDATVTMPRAGSAPSVHPARTGVP